MAETSSSDMRINNLIEYYKYIAKPILQSMYQDIENARDDKPIPRDLIPPFIVNNLNDNKFWPLRDNTSYQKLQKVFQDKSNDSDGYIKYIKDELVGSIYSEFHDSDTKTLYRYTEYDSYQDAINDGHTTQVLLNDCHRNTYYNLEDDTSGRLITEAQRDSIIGSNSKDIETSVSRLLSEKFGMDIKGTNSLKMLTRQTLYPILESYFSSKMEIDGNYSQFGERFIINNNDFVTLLGNRFSSNYPGIKSHDLNKFSNDPRENRGIDFIVTVSIRTNVDKIEVLYMIQSVVEDISDDIDMIDDFSKIPEASVPVKKSIWKRLIGRGSRRKNTKKKTQNKKKRTAIKHNTQQKKKSSKYMKSKLRKTMKN